MARNGISSFGDIIKTTADGQDLNAMWAEYQSVLHEVNEQRTGLVNMFTRRTTLSAQEILQSVEGDVDFEEASEFGVPLRTATQKLILGFPLRWYDAATRYTWKFLLDAPQAQVDAVHQAALEADNRLVYKNVMRALMTKTTIATRPVNEQGATIYPLWAGEADSIPPAFANKTFSAGHDHYLTTQSATVDGNDVRDLVNHVEEHGYGSAQGDQMLVLINPAEEDDIQAIRVGASSVYDFIPSQGAPAYLTQETLVGDRAPAEFQGMKVLGSLGKAWVISHPYVPAGYLIAVAAGGEGSVRNPLAFREHVRPEKHGLRLISGGNSEYPLQESFYARGFGVAVAHRSAAAVMQITASTTYTSPTF